MFTPPRTMIRTTVTIALTTAVLGVGGIAQARQDAGPALADPLENCQLERVGTQFVLCDNLTGNGVPAPAWVPERR